MRAKKPTKAKQVDSESKLPANPPGWKGNVYYPSGKVGMGSCFGTVEMPKDNSGKSKVVFPKLAEKLPDLLS